MPKFVQPKHFNDAFNCPRCGVLSPQHWFDIVKSGDKIEIKDVDLFIIAGRRRASPYIKTSSEENSFRKAWDLTISICQHCNNYTIWENEQIIYPFQTELPEPHEDMYDDVKGIYQEATLVYKH
ncbi:hypothetical protein [Alkalihalobacterium chitinilyticum]|uniref:Uncharacterized protein n=1 Tax=Alkalihalobacterium chitinilyticum TaxID=2980103 RepID=A0ABT5VFF5_9BACI|nr:hypothetical protein [Alkalihalobacterium chitinilyticum]MDE5414184.1 hypothetical protein [Alkalihalobacterium chitinilyticum]